MLAGLFINQWTFFILFSVIHFGCWWEYLGLVEKIYKNPFHKYFKIGLMLIGYGMMAWINLLFYYTEFAFRELIFTIIPFIGYGLLIFGFSRTQWNNIRASRVALLGLFYISLSLGLMLTLWGIGVDASCMGIGGIVGVTKSSIFYFIIFPVIIISSLWVNDTMAYIVGSLIGKTPLTKISPKKTWEGTIGGIILSILVVGYILFPILQANFALDIALPFENYHWFVIAGIASIAGTFGDLLESKLKRMAGVKDSGHIMPGHGGFLDRFDSLLVATPFVWLYVYLFMR